ncbi:hypothetical protein [Pseudoroseicyclus aestuarii]|uniref:Uncharacterized protein n=1 Tax=Pseudoroseicyclus aestuarii TaxID=1795041 RepID=A0A318SQB9_9RHOB|nr:hypothetical protein [Pseudoroseicyclus aestuarii]PYE84071.1 hypothetical protein DFP88_103436 [Pseudoroseicyclus aestuarii]
MADGVVTAEQRRKRRRQITVATVLGFLAAVRLFEAYAGTPPQF